MLVFASKTDIDDEYLKEIVANIATTRNIPLEALDGFYNMIKRDNDMSLGYRDADADFLAKSKKARK